MSSTSTPSRRPHVSVFIASSLDGFIARSDGSLDWLEAVQTEDEDYNYQAFFDSVDTLLMGRKTYDVALTFETWPFASKRCLVLTQRPKGAKHNEEFISGQPQELLERLGAQGVKRIYLDGGSVIRQFLEMGLVDELTLSVVPVLLGDGIPLFMAGGREQRLILDSSRSWPTGLAQLRYRKAE